MKSKNITAVSLFVAAISICSFMAVPLPYGGYITMQTFGIFLSLLMLGGVKGSLAIFVYLLLGAAGAPVFAGFRGGLSCFLEAGGGFLLGFLLIGFAYILFEKLSGGRTWGRIVGLVFGLLLCYSLGTVFFVHLYMQNGNPIGFIGALLITVVPYIVPDAIKLYLAYFLWRRLKKTAFFKAFNAQKG